MRKLFTSLALTLAAATAVANPVDEQKARQIALDFLPSSQSMTLVAQAQRNLAKSIGLSKEVASTSPYYIYSRGEGQGFVIVAGDDCLPSILGYTESGDFDASNLPPALQDMLECWAQSVENAQALGTNAPAIMPLAAADRKNIAPFMKSHWAQGSPYNDRCPFMSGSTTERALTGCVATAASQILYYWRKDLPSTLQATTPTYGYGGAPVTESVEKGTPLRWDLMQDSYSGGESREVKDALAEFIFATGSATWLTYGYQNSTATAGNIENIPNTYNAYFGMNGGTVHYRDNNTQENWVQLIYDELEKGHPVMYTGVSPSAGGHAVVIHGYQKASDLFYFNFGWGGGGDGYYTVTQETGMNGFNGSQSALIGAYPRTWNMTVDMNAPDIVYAQRTNDFTVKIVNNSTLSKQGFYLFAATSASKPSSLSSAKSSDTETVIETGDSATFVLTCKPTSTRTWYVTLTDADLTVLKQIEVTPEVASSQLSLNSVSALSSADTETIDGIEYSKFYSNKALISVKITNEDEMAYEGTGKINIYVYDEETNEWKPNGTNSKSNILIEAGSEADIQFSVSNTASCPLLNGKRYYAEVDTPWKNTASSDDIAMDKATSTKAYFILTGESDLAAISYEDGCLTLGGHWDKAAFETIAKRTTYAQATAYDMTQVEAFANNIDPSVFPNPNALIYIAGSGIEGSLPNVVDEQGVCNELSLTAGYDFRPKADFKARRAQLSFANEVGKWYLITTPFTAKLNDGIFARRIDTHKTSGLTSTCVTEVHELEAGHTYILMTSSLRNDKIQHLGDPAQETLVLAQPLENADPAVVGTFTGTTIPVGAQLINDDATQYFEPVTRETEVGGLRGYFYATNLTKKFRVNITSGVDPAYITLAENISTAYDILDEYASTASPEAYEAYLSSIAAAEHEFSYREDTEELTSATLIKKYGTQLLELAEQYKDGSIADAIAEVTSSTAESTVIAIYNLSGMRIPTLQKGINILRMSDGTTKKVYVP